MEGGLLVLRDGFDLAVEFGGRGLVDAAGVFQAGLAHRLEDAQDADRVGIRRVLRRVETDLDVALGGQVVDLVRPDGLDDFDKAHAVAHVPVVEMEMGMTLQRGDPLAEIHRGAADDAVDLIAFPEQELGKVGAVLAGDAGNECCFHAV